MLPFIELRCLTILRGEESEVSVALLPSAAAIQWGRMASIFVWNKANDDHETTDTELPWEVWCGVVLHCFRFFFSLLLFWYFSLVLIGLQVAVQQSHANEPDASVLLSTTLKCVEPTGPVPGPEDGQCS